MLHSMGHLHFVTFTFILQKCIMLHSRGCIALYYILVHSGLFAFYTVCICTHVNACGDALHSHNRHSSEKAGASYRMRVNALRCIQNAYKCIAMHTNVNIMCINGS